MQTLASKCYCSCDFSFDFDLKTCKIQTSHILAWNFLAWNFGLKFWPEILAWKNQARNFGLKKQARIPGQKFRPEKLFRLADEDLLKICSSILFEVTRAFGKMYRSEGHHPQIAHFSSCLRAELMASHPSVQNCWYIYFQHSSRTALPVTK